MAVHLTNELRAFAADHAWVNENLEALLGDYADQWIGVKDGRVIASDPQLENLLLQLEDPGHTCVEFVTKEPLEMVL